MYVRNCDRSLLCYCVVVLFVNRKYNRGISHPISVFSCWSAVPISVYIRLAGSTGDNRLKNHSIFVFMSFCSSSTKVTLDTVAVSVAIRAKKLTESHFPSNQMLHFFAISHTCGADIGGDFASQFGYVIGLCGRLKILAVCCDSLANFRNLLLLLLGSQVVLLG